MDVAGINKFTVNFLLSSTQPELSSNQHPKKPNNVNNMNNNNKKMSAHTLVQIWCQMMVLPPASIQKLFFYVLALITEKNRQKKRKQSLQFCGRLRGKCKIGLFPLQRNLRT